MADISRRDAIITAAVAAVVASGSLNAAEAQTGDKQRKSVPLEQGKGGTLIHGTAGDMYYIPDQKLTPYKVPEEQAEKIMRALHGSPAADYQSVLGQIRPSLARKLGLIGPDDETVICTVVGAFRQ
jgi:hypothetical protein